MGLDTEITRNVQEVTAYVIKCAREVVDKNVYTGTLGVALQQYDIAVKVASESLDSKNSIPM